MFKLFVVVNVDWFFLSHRKDIALEAQKAGYNVTIVTKDTGKKKDIEALGLQVIDLPMRNCALAGSFIIYIVVKSRISCTMWGLKQYFGEHWLQNYLVFVGW